MPHRRFSTRSAPPSRSRPAASWWDRWRSWAGDRRPDSSRPRSALCSLPDPKVILLGTLDVGVPSADIEESKRIVKLHAEILGEFTPDYLLFLISLTNSKSATIAVSGDIGLLI